MRRAPWSGASGSGTLAGVNGPLRIGDVEVGLPVVQAALSGYSDLAMRVVAREHGATYAINEVVLDALVLQKGKLQRRILSVPEYDHPVGGQLMGSQPETFGDAARKVEVHVIDRTEALYNQPLEVEFLSRLRGVTTFASQDELIQQLHADIAAARHQATKSIRESEQA